MEGKKDGGGGGPSSFRSSLVALLVFFLAIGVCVGLLIGEFTVNSPV